MDEDLWIGLAFLLGLYAIAIRILLVRANRRISRLSLKLPEEEVSHDS